jgi:hypothetical protein
MNILKYVKYTERSTVLHLFLCLFLQSGCNARIKALHFVNAPAYADTVIAMLRAVVKTKLTKRVRMKLFICLHILHTLCYINLHLFLLSNLHGCPGNSPKFVNSITIFTRFDGN